MLDDTIELLTKLYIEEHLQDSDKIQYVIKKEDLMKFCIKLIKFIDGMYTKDIGDDYI